MIPMDATNNNFRCEICGAAGEHTVYDGTRACDRCAIHNGWLVKPNTGFCGCCGEEYLEVDLVEQSDGHTLCEDCDDAIVEWEVEQDAPTDDDAPETSSRAT